MNKGLLYFADDPHCPGLGRDNGDKYIKEASISIGSMRRFHKTCPPVTIFTNHKECNIPNVNLIKIDHEDYKKVTEQDVSYARGSKPNRIMSLMQSPYEYTIYLDNDTFAISPVLDDIYQLLENSDIAMCHSGAIPKGYGREIPATFPELNCGLIAFRKSKCMGLFERWLELYSAGMSGHDQGTFRVAMWESDLKLSVMPQQYNWRYKGSLPLVDSEKPDNKRALVRLDWWKRIPMPRIIHNRKTQQLYAKGKLEKYVK